MLSIDQQGFSEQIAAGLSWIAARAAKYAEEDAWCWTAAAMFALIHDPRLADNRDWQACGHALHSRVASDLEHAFDPRWSSWVDGDDSKRSLLAIDNAPYVLYCLKDVHQLPQVLRSQREMAIRGLMARTWLSGVERGLPLFSADEPSPGATAQLLEVTRPEELADAAVGLGEFLTSRLAQRTVTAETFSWHLSACLAIPELCSREVTVANT